MLIQILALLTQVALAKAPTCTLNLALQNPKANKSCVDILLKETANEQDRADLKFLFNSWKPVPGLRLHQNGPYMAAEIDGKVIYRALWLSWENPAMLWVNGKILTDNSNNPSVFRRVANMFKPEKFAGLFLNQAHAQTISHKVHGEVIAAQSTVLASRTRMQLDHNKEYAPYFPGTDPLLRLMPTSWAKTAECSGTVMNGTFELNERREYGVSPQYKITQLEPHKFFVKGILDENSRHVITINFPAFDARVSVKQLAHWTGETALIAACLDENCKNTDRLEKLSDWNLELRMTPDQEHWEKRTGREFDVDSKGEENVKLRSQLGGLLFTLAVAGDCCTDKVCRDLILKRYNVKLKSVSPTGATTSH